MNKRRFEIAAMSTLLLLLLSFCACAEGSVRRVQTELPSVRVEFSDRISDEAITSAKLGDETLKLVAVEESTNLSKLVYFLIDISTSMRQEDLDALKPGLIRYINQMNKRGDKAVLMTFGDGTKTLLEGGEDAATVKSVIDSIKCNGRNTTFYRALTNAFEKAKIEKEYAREMVIAISDGVDIEVGNSSQQEVIDQFKTHQLPVFALCQSKTSKTSADGFGYIARSSGGELVLFDKNNADVSLKAIESAIDSVSMITLKSAKRKSAGTQELQLCVENKTYQLSVPVSAKSDTKAPLVKEIIFDKEKSTFEITFSEPVENADKVSSYTIRQNKKNLRILSVKYKGKKASLLVNDVVYSGEYAFDFENITDSSDNQNELETSRLTVKIEAIPLVFKVLKIIGLSLIAPLFFLLLYFLLLLIKKKKRVRTIREIFVEQVEEERHETVHVKAQKGLDTRFYIDGADGTFRKLRYTILSSVIIGNSDMCDIRVDDSWMSPQHFAIERVDNGLVVMDLDSVNGTYVNGVPIQSPTFLNSEDRVFAGNTTIRVLY